MTIILLQKSVVHLIFSSFLFSFGIKNPGDQDLCPKKKKKREKRDRETEIFGTSSDRINRESKFQRNVKSIEKLCLLTIDVKHMDLLKERQLFFGYLSDLDPLINLVEENE